MRCRYRVALWFTHTHSVSCACLVLRVHQDSEPETIDTSSDDAAKNSVEHITDFQMNCPYSAFYGNEVPMSAVAQYMLLDNNAPGDVHDTSASSSGHCGDSSAKQVVPSGVLTGMLDTSEFDGPNPALQGPVIQTFARAELEDDEEQIAPHNVTAPLHFAFCCVCCCKSMLSPHKFLEAYTSQRFSLAY